MADEEACFGCLISDLSGATPVAFIHNLKQAYVDGKGKAGTKFQALRERVTKFLPTAPPPGPATFVVRCMEVLLFIEPPHNEGLSHLLTSALNHLSPAEKPDADAAVARKMASELFTKAIKGTIKLDSRVLTRAILVFQIQLIDIGQVILKEESSEEQQIREAKASVVPFILNLVKDKSYTSAITLLKQFDLQECTPQEFLVTMVADGQPELAGRWAAHLGKEMSCYLVQQCTDMGLYKVAYKLVESYNLVQSFPDAYQLYKRSSIRKLVDKGLWDVAEAIAVEAHLKDYLVKLAIEEGHTSELANLCQRWQLEHAVRESSLTEDDSSKPCYLQLSSITPLENVFFVDSAQGLTAAAEHFMNVTVVGIDCEWKAIHEKGTKENKVSILQLATREKVFIFDLIELADKESAALNHCIKLVFHSPRILKLGYAVRNDLKKLLQSYQDLECFGRCESVLDLQTFAGPKVRGGLSGLTKVALGNSLDKRKQMSDWEQRPLSTEQLHYAALDAAVLISIFGHLSSQPITGPGSNDGIQDWKHLLISFRSAWKQGINVKDSARKNLLDLSSYSSSTCPDGYRSGEMMGQTSYLRSRFESDAEASNSSTAQRLDLMHDDYTPTLISGSSSWTVRQDDIRQIQLDHLALNGVCGGNTSTAAPVFSSQGDGVRATLGEDSKETQSLLSTHNEHVAEDGTSFATETTLPSTTVPVVGSINDLTEEMAALAHSVQESILTSFEDVVGATYLLLDQPTPGLLKNELEALARGAGLPSPIYQAVSWGPKHQPLFCCVVHVAGVYILGGSAYRKRDAEFLAAQMALSYLASETQDLNALISPKIFSLNISGGFGTPDAQVSLVEVAESIRNSRQLQINGPQLNIFSASDQACVNHDTWLRDVGIEGDEIVSNCRETRLAPSFWPANISRKGDFRIDASLQKWGRGGSRGMASHSSAVNEHLSSLPKRVSRLKVLPMESRRTGQGSCYVSQQKLSARPLTACLQRPVVSRFFSRCEGSLLHKQMFIP